MSKQLSPSKELPGAADRIVQALTQELRAGKFGDHGALPGEYQLGDRFSVSRGTVRHALAQLERRGLIYRVQGKGTFAVPPMEVNIKPVALLLREPHKAVTPFISDVIRGAHSYLTNASSHLVLTSMLPGEWSSDFVQNTGGVLIIPKQIVDSDLTILRRLKMPFMLVLEGDLNGPTTRMGMQQAARELTQGLLDLGHQRLAMVSGHFEHIDRMKKAGIAEALETVGLKMSDVPDYCTNYDPQAARQAAQVILRSTDRPTAIMAFDDDLAVQVIQVAHEFGLKVPKDLSVVGFNDHAFSSLISPSLSTVRFPGLDAGYQATELLCQAQKKSHALHDILLKHEIRWRNSTGPVPQ